LCKVFSFGCYLINISAVDAVSRKPFRTIKAFKAPGHVSKSFVYALNTRMTRLRIASTRTWSCANDNEGTRSWNT